MKPIIKKIEKYIADYKIQTRAMKASKLESSSKSLIIECEIELLKLMRNREIALKTIKRLRKCISQTKTK